jgi:hypothetical protein
MNVTGDAPRKIEEWGPHKCQRTVTVMYDNCRPLLILKLFHSSFVIG